MSSSSKQTVVWHKELLSWQVTHRVAPFRNLSFLRSPTEESEVREESAEKQPFTVDIVGMASGADVAHATSGLMFRSQLKVKIRLLLKLRVALGKSV